MIGMFLLGLFTGVPLAVVILGLCKAASPAPVVCRHHPDERAVTKAQCHDQDGPW